ncbi:MAG: hypothetical protein GWN16_04770, partial [Calditrichae bacterium]|nr:hypothetical protein [Calditrichia bacterium]
MLTYHYVFAIISMALLGLGLGAMLLKKVKRFVCGANYVAYACGIAFTIGASAIAIIKLPLFNSGDLVNIRIWIYIMLITIPFFFAGLTFAELFQKFPE